MIHSPGSFNMQPGLRNANTEGREWLSYIQRMRINQSCKERAQEQAAQREPQRQRRRGRKELGLAPGVERKPLCISMMSEGGQGRRQDPEHSGPCDMVTS